jgi:hypothetical protein
VGLYLLPLLIWYPIQLMMSAALLPRIRIFVNDENEKLGLFANDEPSFAVEH